MSEEKSKEIKRIICGDNLEILTSIPNDFFDLIYIDPPFFTSRNYEVIWGNGEEIRAFEDRWVKHGDGKYSKDINVYLNFMEPRIKEIHRVLKDTGSMYLHCDYHANSYLRILCDQIFGYKNLLNEIIWHYRTGGVSKRWFGRKSDTLLLYKKGKKWTFNPIQVKEYYKDVYGADFKPSLKDRKGGEDEKGYYHYIYEDNVWDIRAVFNMSHEYMGYPTQKPEKLLERVIKASSNEGDVVGDFFCGCGTSLAVAERLKRQWVGCDISATACRLVAERVGSPLMSVEGIPLEAEEVKELGGWEFQNYVINLLTIYDEHVIVNKRGADGGIDGKYLEQLISVKKYKAGRKDLDEFVATIYRNKKEVGIFIALGYTSGFLKEVARLQREDEIEIIPLSLEQIINKEHFSILKKFRKNIDKFI